MISSDLYDIVRQYLESSISIHQLEEWIVPRLPDLLSKPDSDDSKLVATIELGFAEINNNNIDENEFRSWLNNELRDHNVVMVDFSDQQNTSINSTTTSNKIYTEEYTMLNNYEIVRL